MSEPINFFLWVSHGSNVSSENNFYPIQTKFKSIILYSKPFQTIYGTDLVETTSNPCRLILGTCPYIPVNYGYGNHVFLPPLIFENIEAETDQVVRGFTGLYHYVLDVDPNQINPTNIPFGAPLNCVVISSEKIYDHGAFLRMYGTRRITYSQIFKLVTDTSSARNLNIEDVLLGIYSCQTVMNAYSGEYTPQISNLIPKRIDTNLIQAARIFTSMNYPRNSLVSMTVINIYRLTNNWNALAGITHQGCALNVFSYFGIIPDISAREQTVCLSLKGTSIFKIIDFINIFIIETTNNPPLGYFVVRLDFEGAISDIVEFMVSYSEDNYFIIFKMYTEEYQANTQNKKYSHIGHTVAMFKHDKSYYYVDPQASIIQELTGDITQTISTIRGLPGNNDKKFIDLIFTVREEFPENRPKLDSSVFVIKSNSRGLNILERTPDINFGGRKLLKKKNKSLIKTKNKSMKKQKNKKSKSIKKRKNNKSKKNHIGGNDETKLDNFQQLMIDIDKEHNIPTVLSISVIKDIP